MTLSEFVNKYLGQKIDFDGYYGGQCVDLYRQYVKDVLGYPQSPGVGGAAEIWDSASNDYYDFIKNDPYAVPEPGDIVIWNRRVGGGFGHVAIYLDGDVNGFTSLDQNWPTLSKVTKTQHNYTNVIGWLHPKKESMSDSISIPSKTFEELVNKSSRWDEVLKLGYGSASEIKSDVASYKKEIANLRDEIKIEKDRADNNRQQLNHLIAETAKALGTVQEEAQIMAALEKVSNQLDALDDLERQYAELQVEAGAEREELNAEIERLKALIKHGNVGDFTFEELIAEIIKRLKEIIRR